MRPYALASQRRAGDTWGVILRSECRDRGGRGRALAKRLDNKRERARGRAATRRERLSARP